MAWSRLLIADWYVHMRSHVDPKTPFTQRLLTEYAFFLQEGGLLYAITDGA